MDSDIAVPSLLKATLLLDNLDFSSSPTILTTLSTFPLLYFPVPLHIMPAADKKPRTLYDKVLDAHIVNEQEDGTLLLYIGGF